MLMIFQLAPKGFKHAHAFPIKDCCWPATCEHTACWWWLTEGDSVCVVTFIVIGIAYASCIIVLLSCRTHGGSDYRSPQHHEGCRPDSCLATKDGGMK